MAGAPTLTIATEAAPAGADAAHFKPAVRKASARLPSSSLLPYALLAPSLVILAAFTYWPIVQVVRDSLYLRQSAGRAPVFGGLANFEALWRDAAFTKALINNIAYAAGTVIPSLVIALGIAMALSGNSRVNALLRSVFFLPVLIPLVAAASLFLFIFLPGVGLIDHHLAKLSISGANWIGDPDLALGSLTVLTIWKNAGYYMLFFLAGLQGVPPDAYDAAHLDGASPWQRLTLVTLPYLKPTIAFVVVIALLNAVTQVDHVFILTKGGPSDSTNLLLFYVYQQAVENYDIGKASAATLISLMLLLALSISSMRTMDRTGDRGDA